MKLNARDQFIKEIKEVQKTLIHKIKEEKEVTYIETRRKKNTIIQAYNYFLAIQYTTMYSQATKEQLTHDYQGHLNRYADMLMLIENTYKAKYGENIQDVEEVQKQLKSIKNLYRAEIKAQQEAAIIENKIIGLKIKIDSRNLEIDEYHKMIDIQEEIIGSGEYSEEDEKQASENINKYYEIIETLEGIIEELNGEIAAVYDLEGLKDIEEEIQELRDCIDITKRRITDLENQNTTLETSLNSPGFEEHRKTLYLESIYNNGKYIDQFESALFILKEKLKTCKFTLNLKKYLQRKYIKGA